MMRALKRALSLFLAVLMWFTALRVPVAADLSDIYEPEAGVAEDTLALPFSEEELEPDDEDEADEPIDYADTLRQDFTFKDDGSLGSAQNFNQNVAYPTYASYVIERHYTESSLPLQRQYRADLRTLRPKVREAEAGLKDAQKAYDDFISTYKAQQRAIRHKHSYANTGYKSGTMTKKLGKLANEKQNLTTKLTNAKKTAEGLQAEEKGLREATQAKMPRNTKLYKTFKGVMIAFSVIMGFLGYVDMIINPGSGYKSDYLEMLASFFRAGSNVFGMLSWLPPFVIPAMACAVGDMIMSCETVKAFLNKYLPSIPFYDQLAQLKNWQEQKFFGFFFWLADDSDARVREQDMRKFAHLTGKQSNLAISGTLPPGVYDIVRGATACARHINAYKPNIYLYPASPTEMRVSFTHPSALSVTDPVYPKTGWSCTALPDGTLYVDGTAYSFLFYEAVTSDRFYQREEGFLIPAESRAETFASILEQYGLNEREIDDFNAYWCEKLEPDCDYAMYPQLTQTVDEAMPMRVSPAPDSILRIWFAFEKNGVPARTASPTAFERSGTALLEWGGLFLDE